MSSTNEPADAILIGTAFCSRTEFERGMRSLLRAAVLLSSHPEYLAASQTGDALRKTRISLIALRDLLERGVGEEVWE